MKIKRFLYFGIMMIICVNVARSQDNSSLAQIAYVKAEEYFLQEQYSMALTQLNIAEKYLGETNSKILYLKINVLKTQFKNSSNNFPTLKGSISQFFQITDKNSYPPDKYSEMVRLQLDILEFIESDSITCNNLLNHGDLTSITSYLNSNPNTFYYSKLKNRQAELQKIEDKIEAKIAIENRLNELSQEISRAKAKSFRRRFWGGFKFLAGGAIGATALLQKYLENETAAVTITRTVIGGLAIVASGSGAISLIKGNHKEVKLLKKEQFDLLDRKKSIIVYIEPHYKPFLTYNTLGLNIKVPF